MLRLSAVQGVGGPGWREALATELGLSGTDSAALAQALLREHEAGLHTLLILDDGEQLEPAQVQALVSFAQGDDSDNASPLAVVLLARPVDAWPAPTGVHRLRIAPLTRDSAEDFLSAWCVAQGCPLPSAAKRRGIISHVVDHEAGAVAALLQRLEGQAPDAGLSGASTTNVFSSPVLRLWRHGAALLAVGVVLAWVAWKQGPGVEPERGARLEVVLPSAQQSAQSGLAVAQRQVQEEPEPPIARAFSQDQPDQSGPELAPAPSGNSKVEAESEPLILADPDPEQRAVDQPPLGPAQSPEWALLREREAAVLALNPRLYTLQFLGSYHLRTVIDFVEGLGGCEHCYLLETRHQNRPWYVAVMGLYPSREAAAKARTDLEPDMRRMDPWIRPIEALQTEVRGRSRTREE